MMPSWFNINPSWCDINPYVIPFLGAIVYGFDVRAAAKEQVESAGEW